MDVKGLIFGIAVGGAAGFACGYLISKSKVRKEAEQEIEELRSYYRKKRDEILDICKPDEAKDEVTTYCEADVEELTNHVMANGYSYEPVKEEPKVKDPIDEFKEATQKVEETRPKEIKQNDIGVQTEIISQEDYDDNTYGYDKDVIIYYIYNEVCTDSTGDVLINPQQYIGNVFLNPSVNKHVQESNSIYVRNHELETDYEVILEFDQYLEGADND